MNGSLFDVDEWQRAIERCRQNEAAAECSELRTLLQADIACGLYPNSVLYRWIAEIILAEDFEGRFVARYIARCLK